MLKTNKYWVYSVDINGNPVKPVKGFRRHNHAERFQTHLEHRYPPINFAVFFNTISRARNLQGQ